MSNKRPKPEKSEKPKMAQRLSRDLTCSICLDLFKQPVSLPCDHTFCQSCITNYWSGGGARAPGQPGTGSSGSCPQCRKVFPGQSYRPNRIVANIVESYSREIEEESASSAPSLAPRCARHREELKLYCEEEHELVCLVCAVSQEHRAHALVCVDEAEQKYRVGHVFCCPFVPCKMALQVWESMYAPSSRLMVLG